MTIKKTIASIGLVWTLALSWCWNNKNITLTTPSQEVIDTNNSNIQEISDTNKSNINNIISEKIENITPNLNSPFIIKAEYLNNWAIYYDFKKETQDWNWVLSIYYYWKNSDKINIFYINKDWVKTNLEHWNFWPQWEEWTMVWWYYSLENASDIWNIRIWVELKENYTTENDNISNLYWDWVIMHFTWWLENNWENNLPELNLKNNEKIILEANQNSYYYLDTKENYLIQSINWWQFSINEYDLIWNTYSWKWWILRIPKWTKISIIKN